MNCKALAAAGAPPLGRGLRRSSASSVGWKGRFLAGHSQRHATHMAAGLHAYSQGVPHGPACSGHALTLRGGHGISAHSLPPNPQYFSLVLACCCMQVVCVQYVVIGVRYHRGMMYVSVLSLLLLIPGTNLLLLFTLATSMAAAAIYLQRIIRFRGPTPE